MATSTHKPSGDGTSSGVENENGGTTNLYTSVDEDFSTPNDVDFIRNAGETDGSVFFDLTDMAVDFSSMTSITLNVRRSAAPYTTLRASSTYQLLTSPNDLTTADWVKTNGTVTNNGDGTYTMVPTASATNMQIHQVLSGLDGHWITVRYKLSGSGTVNVTLQKNGGDFSFYGGSAPGLTLSGTPTWVEYTAFKERDTLGVRARLYNLADGESCTIHDVEVIPRYGVIIPCYNDDGKNAIINNLVAGSAGNQIGAGDTLMVVTGNSGSIYANQGAGWPSTTAADLKTAFPNARIILGVAGHDDEVVEGDGFDGNIQRAVADTLDASIEGITYIYEPGLEFQPRVYEFWTDNTTLDWTQANAVSNQTTAATLIRNAGLLALGKPTGRPLYQSYLWDSPEFGEWDYAALANELDELLIQTQTYSDNFDGEWKPAMDRLRAQIDAVSPWSVGTNRPVTIQTTVGVNNPNAVSDIDAGNAMRYAQEVGLNGILIWHAPADIANVQALLDKRELTVTV